MRAIFNWFVAVLAIIILFSNCKKLECSNCGIGRISVIANAGQDTLIKFPSDSIILNGQKSTGNKIVGWLWRKLHGPVSAKIVNPNFSKTLVTNADSGVYF